MALVAIYTRMRSSKWKLAEEGSPEHDFFLYCQQNCMPPKRSRPPTREEAEEIKRQVRQA